ncbi:MAG: nicotinamide riboside transporter PnuC [Eubacteriales bacterium]
MIKYLKCLSRFELGLWIVSLIVVSGSFLLSQNFYFPTLIASLIGVTGLIFVAKGHVAGMVITVIFSILYGFISWQFAYYGEVITYLGMTAPMAIVAMIAWIRNPFKQGENEVAIANMDRDKVMKLILFTTLVTIAFYFILGYFHTENLVFSTLSITTSFAAVYLTYCRSAAYALAYALNDIVLIVLWILATMEDTAYLTMVVCFLMFLVNDFYGYYNWMKMKKKQEKQG